MELSEKAQCILSAIKKTYRTPENGWFTEEGFFRKTFIRADHSVFEELHHAGHIEYADVYVWKRTNYDK